MKNLPRRSYIGSVLFFLYIPMFVMIILSFNESKSRSNFTGFTFEWYEKLFDNELIMNSFFISIIIALLSSIIAVILGTFAAIGIQNMKKTTRSIVLNISYIPIINPDIITGISLMILFVSMSNYNTVFSLGFYTILIAHITFCTPYVILNVLPKLRQLDNGQYEAALDLGCNHKQAFLKVILPQIMPGIITGFLISFAFSIDDFIVSYFTSGPSSQTLPLTINSMIRKIITPEIYALSTIMFLFVLVVIFIYNVIDNRKYKTLKLKEKM